MKILVFLLLAASFQLPAHANLMEVSGSFSGMPKSMSNGTILPFGGSFTYIYDSASIPASGFFTLEDVHPSTLFLDHPVVGSITFDVTNTFLDVGFTNGVLNGFLLGDFNNGGGIGGTDDFTVFIYDDGKIKLANFILSIASSSFYFGFDFHGSGSFAVSPYVPEGPPSSVPDTTSSLMLLFPVMLAAVALRRGRKRGMVESCAYLTDGEQ